MTSLIISSICWGCFHKLVELFQALISSSNRILMEIHNIVDSVYSMGSRVKR